MKRALIALLLSACTAVPTPEPPNSVSINGAQVEITSIHNSPIEIAYADETTEPGISVRVLTSGGPITAEIPLHMTGQEINLMSRNLHPTAGSHYYTFHVSARGAQGFYCRVLSWGPSEPYSGTFSISPTTNNRYIFTWSLNDELSRGYVTTPLP